MSKKRIPFLIGLLLLSSCYWAMAQSTPAEEEDLLAAGILLYERGDYKAAIPVLRSAYLQLEKEKEKASQAKTQYYLAQSYLYTGNTEEAITTYRQSYQLSQRYGPADILLLATEALGEMLQMSGKHQEAIQVLRHRIFIARQQKAFNNMTIAYSCLGLNFMRLGQLDSARWYMEEALAIKTQRGDTVDLKMHYNHLGNLYQELGDYDQSIHYHLLVLKALEAANKRPQMVIAYTNIGDILREQGNLPRAEVYTLKAIELGEAEDLITWLGVAYHNMGNIRQEQNRMDEALKSYEQALQQYRISKTGAIDFNVLSNIGMLYLKKGEFEIAEQHLQEGLELAYQKNRKRGIIDGKINLALLKTQTKQFVKANNLLKEVFPELIDYNHPQYLTNYYHAELQYHQALGNHQAALNSYRQQEHYRQKQFNLEQNEKVHELEERYERVKKDREIRTLNAEHQIQDVRIQQSRRNTLLATIGLLFAAVLIVFLYFYNRTKRLSNQKLAEKNLLISKSLNEKEILLREIHHRVKNNLQVISSLLRLQTRYIKNEKALDAIEEGRNRVKSMAMIHQNLYQEDNLTGIDAGTYIQRLSDSLFNSYNIDHQRIQLSTDIDPLNIDVDTIIPLGLILNELITNALKYAFPPEENGEVKVRLKQEANHLLLEVSDDGMGIKWDNQTSKRKEGFGMKLIETFASKLNAKLEIQQENGTAIRLLIKKYKLV